MSMISEQVKELRENAKWFDSISLPKTMNILSQAADTIETLSAKLAANNNEWIACEDRLPKEHEDFRDIFDPDTLAIIDTEHYMASDLVQITVYEIDKDEYFVCNDCTVDGKWSNFGSESFKVVAWQPLPEPYKPTEERKHA